MAHAKEWIAATLPRASAAPMRVISTTSSLHPAGLRNRARQLRRVAIAAETSSRAVQQTKRLLRAMQLQPPPLHDTLVALLEERHQRLPAAALERFLDEPPLLCLLPAPAPTRAPSRAAACGGTAQSGRSAEPSEAADEATERTT